MTRFESKQVQNSPLPGKTQCLRGGLTLSSLTFQSARLYCAFTSTIKASLFSPLGLPHFRQPIPETFQSCIPTQVHRRTWFAHTDELHVGRWMFAILWKVMLVERVEIPDVHALERYKLAHLFVWIGVADIVTYWRAIPPPRSAYNWCRNEE